MEKKKHNYNSAKFKQSEQITKHNKTLQKMGDEHVIMLSVLNGPYRGVFLRDYVIHFLQKNDLAIITKESPGLLETFLTFIFREIVDQKVLEQNVIPVAEIAMVENTLEIFPPTAVPILNVDELGNMCVDLGGGVRCEIPIDVDYAEDYVGGHYDDCGVDAIFEKTLLKAFVSMPSVSDVPSMGNSYLISPPPTALCDLEQYMIVGEQELESRYQSRYRNICELDYSVPQLLPAIEEHEFVCKRIVKSFLTGTLHADKFPENDKTLLRRDICLRMLKHLLQHNMCQKIEVYDECGANAQEIYANKLDSKSKAVDADMLFELLKFEFSEVCKRKFVFFTHPKLPTDVYIKNNINLVGVLTNWLSSRNLLYPARTTMAVPMYNFFLALLVMVIDDKSAVLEFIEKHKDIETPETGNNSQAGTVMQPYVYSIKFQPHCQELYPAAKRLQELYARPIEFVRRVYCAKLNIHNTLSPEQQSAAPFFEFNLVGRNVAGVEKFQDHATVLASMVDYIRSCTMDIATTCAFDRIFDILKSANLPDDLIEVQYIMPELWSEPKLKRRSHSIDDEDDKSRARSKCALFV